MEEKIKQLITRHSLDKNLTREKIERGLDWSGADLTGFNLQGLDLSYINPGDKANFQGVKFQDTNLKNVLASGADFKKADFYRADLRNAVLFETDFSNSNFEFAFLDKVNFVNANLTNANLTRATVENTNFSEAILTNTTLDEVEIDKAQGLEYAHGLTTINESSLFPSRLIYLRLENYFRNLGQHDDQANCYYRRKIVQRKIWYADGKLKRKIRWFGSLLFDWLCGYGEEPIRVIGWALIIVFICGILFFIMGGPSGQGTNTFVDSFYFSGITFTTVGFGDLYPNSTNITMKILTDIEAFSGVFLMSLFTVSLARKFMR